MKVHENFGDASVTNLYMEMWPNKDHSGIFSFLSYRIDSKICRFKKKKNQRFTLQTVIF